MDAPENILITLEFQLSQLESESSDSSNFN